METYTAVLIVACLAVCVFALRAVLKAGLLKPIILTKGTFPPERVAVRTVQGPYHNIGKEFAKLVKFLDDLPLKPLDDPEAKTIGIYHDDPCTVGDEKCRSSVGVCLNSFTSPKRLQEVLEQRGFTVLELPKVEAIVGKFPFTGTLSIMLYLHKMFGSKGALANYHRDHPELQARKTDVRHIEVYTANKELLEIYVTLENMGGVFNSLVKES